METCVNSADGNGSAYPNFAPAFEQLLQINNRIFGRTLTAKSRLEDLCFSLGHTCRDDYLEIAFLSVHARENAATKLLRGLYERAVTIAYMIQKPAEAERFVRFAAIQEHRATQAALKLVGEAEFDQHMAGGTSAQQLREHYSKWKGEFEETICKKCGKKRVQAGWDVDVASMVASVGEPYLQLFLLAYTIPTMAIHATLASALDNQDRSGSADPHLSLIVATEIILEVLRTQDRFFSLGLTDDLSSCLEQFRVAWPHLHED